VLVFSPMKFAPFMAAAALCFGVQGVAFAQYSNQGQYPNQGYPNQGQYPNQAQPPPMQSGGLAPPSGSTSDAESAQTEQRLDDADKRDSGRGLEGIYVNAEIGIEHLGLDTLHANHLVDTGVVDTTQTGPMIGVGAGVRLLFLTIGPRFRLGMLSKYQVWTLDAEIGMHFPLGNLEPYFALSGGYAHVGAFDAKDLGGASESDVSISGYDIRLGGGVDYYVTPVFSVGASLTGDMLGLSRSAVGAAKLTSANADNVYKADGSSIGLAVTGAAVLGLHF